MEQLTHAPLTVEECLYKHAAARGIWGYAPKNFKIRCPGIASDVISRPKMAPDNTTL